MIKIDILEIKDQVENLQNDIDDIDEDLQEEYRQMNLFDMLDEK